MSLTYAQGTELEQHSQITRKAQIKWDMRNKVEVGFSLQLFKHTCHVNLPNIVW